MLVDIRTAVSNSVHSLRYVYFPTPHSSSCSFLVWSQLVLEVGCVLYLSVPQTTMIILSDFFPECSFHHAVSVCTCAAAVCDKLCTFDTDWLSVTQRHNKFTLANPSERGEETKSFKTFFFFFNYSYRDPLRMNLKCQVNSDDMTLNKR